MRESCNCAIYSTHIMRLLSPSTKCKLNPNQEFKLGGTDTLGHLVMPI